MGVTALCACVKTEETAATAVFADDNGGAAFGAFEAVERSVAFFFASGDLPEKNVTPIPPSPSDIV